MSALGESYKNIQSERNLKSPLQQIKREFSKCFWKDAISRFFQQKFYLARMLDKRG